MIHQLTYFDHDGTQSTDDDQELEQICPNYCTNSALQSFAPFVNKH